MKNKLAGGIGDSRVWAYEKRENVKVEQACEQSSRAIGRKHVQTVQQKKDD